MIDDVAIREAYDRAQARLLALESKQILNAAILPKWVSETVFVFRKENSAGHRFVAFDVISGRLSDAFDHQRLAALLMAATGSEVAPEQLPITGLRAGNSPGEFMFECAGQSYRLTAGGDIGAVERHPLDWSISPDGKTAVYIKDFDLWARDLASGREWPLTADGERFFPYAVNPHCRRVTPSFQLPGLPPELIWSDDSRNILTVQTDDRLVDDAPLIQYLPGGAPGRPAAVELRMAFPGDPAICTFRVVAIDVRGPRVIAAKHRQLPSIRMLDTPVAAGTLWWDRDRAYFIDIDRGERRLAIMRMDPETGDCQTILEENSDSWIDLSPDVYLPAIIHPYGPDRILMFSERSGMAHLDLVDLAAGTRAAVTAGPWRLCELLTVDTSTGTALILASGRDTAHPYQRQIARVDITAGEVSWLTDDAFDHSIVAPEVSVMALLNAVFGIDAAGSAGLSPDGRYIVDTFGAVDCLPKTVVRSTADGAAQTVVEASFRNGAPEWHWPKRHEIILDSGERIYGIVFLPPGAKGKVPAIDFVYGGPQASHMPRTSFNGPLGATTYLQAAALAELGFAVVMLDGRGTADRSYRFQHHASGQIDRASDIDDHVAFIRSLADRFPIDIERIGVTGFSAGGYLAARALLMNPEFYKVGVAVGGNHDQRLFWASWGERFHGPVESTDYINQANGTHVAKLRGHLLLIHGLLDTGCHPASFFQLIEAFIKANKDVDILPLPTAGHEVTGYATRRIWDYFVRHFLGCEPPADYVVHTDHEAARARLVQAYAEVSAQDGTVDHADAN